MRVLAMIVVCLSSCSLFGRGEIPEGDEWRDQVIEAIETTPSDYEAVLTGKQLWEATR